MPEPTKRAPAQRWPPTTTPGVDSSRDAYFDTHATQTGHSAAAEAGDLGGATARVFLGGLAGEVSPVPTFTPLLGAEIVLEPHARVALPVDPGYEHGVLVDTGSVALARTRLQPSELGYLAPGAHALELSNLDDRSARVLLLGGVPFEEDIVMWWNFVGRSHEEIVAFREAWVAEAEQFGRIDGYRSKLSRLPAPALPNARLTPRRHS